MSKIYEALKKAQQEKATLGDQGAPQASPVELPSRPMLDSHPSPAVAEEYRKMFNSIKLKNSDHKMKVILIASSVQGEGTSSVCSPKSGEARSTTQGVLENLKGELTTLKSPASG